MHHPITGGRRTVTAVLAVLTLAAALLVPACSGGEESKPATDGAEQSNGDDATTDSGQAPETAPPVTIPPSTVPDDEFANIIDGLNGQFDAAGDGCELLAVMGSAGGQPTPANPDQVKAATELYALLLRRLSESPPPGQEAAAPTLAAAADQLIAEGEASGWDLNTVANSAALSPEVQRALTAYNSACSVPGLDGSTSGQPAG